MRSSRCLFLCRSLAASLLVLGFMTSAANIVHAADMSVPATAGIGPDETIATVNGEPIKLSDITLADEEMSETLSQLPEDKQFQYLLGMLIDRTIVAQAAKAQKMEDDPAVKRREAYFHNKALHDVYWDQMMRTKVGEKQIKAYYDTKIATVEPENEAHAAHILVGSKEEAEKIEADIKAGKNFEDEAKALSKDPSGANGGDLGWFKKDAMVTEFGDAAFSMKPGEISAPVKTQFGWHIIKLIAIRKAPKQTYEQAHDSIMRTLLREEGQKTLGSMRREAKIEVIGNDTSKSKMVPVQAP